MHLKLLNKAPKVNWLMKKNGVTFFLLPVSVRIEPLILFYGILTTYLMYVECGWEPNKFVNITAYSFIAAKLCIFPRKYIV